MIGLCARSLLLCHLALAVAATGVAWACVPQPMLLVEPKASAAAGANVTVGGLNFGRRAEIRFNGVSGPLLDTASGEQFKAKVRVPRAPAGLYTLVALTRDQSGSVSGMATASLEITDARGDRQGASSAGAGRAGSGPSDEASSDGVSHVLVAGGALVLLLLGGLTGALLARRRLRSPGSTGSTG